MAKQIAQAADGIDPAQILASGVATSTGGLSTSTSKRQESPSTHRGTQNGQKGTFTTEQFTECNSVRVQGALVGSPYCQRGLAGETSFTPDPPPPMPPVVPDTAEEGPLCSALLNVRKVGDIHVDTERGTLVDCRPDTN